MKKGPERSGEITIKDIAKHLGLSHPTVSRALRDMPGVRAGTRDRVKQAAQALGYIPNSGARMLRRTRSELIGVVFPDIQNDFYSTTTTVLAARFLAHGYKLVLASSEDQADTELKHIQSLREARVAGIIIAPSAHPCRESIALLAAIPCVQLLRRHPALPATAVLIDEQHGALLATRHLIAQGHRRVGLITGHVALSTGRARETGYREAMAEAGLTADEDLIHQGPPRACFGATAMAHLLDLARPPTAVMVASSQPMLGVLAVIQQRGIRVPGDLALAGYHDPTWFALWGPGLSTIRLPVQDMATTAASLLLDQLHPGDEVQHARKQPDHVLIPQLVERGSSLAGTAEDAIEIVAANPDSPEAQTCIQAYFAELRQRFEEGFDPALSVSADPDELMPPRGCFLLALGAGRPAGCIALKITGKGRGEIKRMWVAPDARGTGLGKRLLQEAEARARDAGVDVLQLDTHRALIEARRFYQRNGYVEIAAYNDNPYAHHWFEKRGLQADSKI
ncbi:MAG: GNAT family N-acetyltransferase [Castellaniella sp.]